MPPVQRVRDVDDELLIAEALVAASFAYGDDQWTRADVVKAFLCTLPDVRARDAASLYREAARNVRRDGALARIRRLHALRDDVLRRRCLVLAIDVAMSSGVLDDGETIELIRQSLDIPAEDALDYARVLQLKYRRVLPLFELFETTSRASPKQAREVVVDRRSPPRPRQADQEPRGVQIR